jgi:hypothetical protein
MGRGSALGTAAVGAHSTPARGYRGPGSAGACIPLQSRSNSSMSPSARTD